MALVLACALAGTVASPARAQPASATLLACHQARQPADRFVAVEGAMGGVVLAERMQMRFDLHRRAGPGDPFRPVPGPGLGVYSSAERGAAQYRFRRTVRNLVRAGDYRVTVSFRWLGSGGEVLARAVRLAALCHQRDPRPDLVVTALTVGPAGTGQRSYSVTVANRGEGAAAGFDVALAVGSRRSSAAVAGLGVGERTVVVLTASACAAGRPVVAKADAAGRVSEASEANNARGVSCPGGAGPGAASPVGGARALWLDWTSP